MFETYLDDKNTSPWKHSQPFRALGIDPSSTLAVQLSDEAVTSLEQFQRPGLGNIGKPLTLPLLSPPSYQQLESAFTKLNENISVHVKGTVGNAHFNAVRCTVHNLPSDLELFKQGHVVLTSPSFIHQGYIHQFLKRKPPVHRSDLTLKGRLIYQTKTFVLIINFNRIYAILHYSLLSFSSFYFQNLAIFYSEDECHCVHNLSEHLPSLLFAVSLFGIIPIDQTLVYKL